MVMACRMMTPAFSISFLDSPDVMQTLRAGLMTKSLSLSGPSFFTTGRLLSLVIRTPLASACIFG